MLIIYHLSLTFLLCLPTQPAAPGTCVPYAINLPIQTLWYWCGWKTIDRSRFIVKVSDKAKDANFSAVLMRKKDLDVSMRPHMLLLSD